MQALKAQYEQRGPVPQDVIKPVPFDTPALAPGQALVAVLAAPINPSDVLMLTGGYGMLPPLPGLNVRSIVGRFLEHTRVSYFRWGEGDDEEALYLASADWMSRNMFGRIEVAWPIADALLRQRVIDECLVPYLHDRQDAWLLRADGSYEAVARDGPGAQHALMQRFQ